MTFRFSISSAIIAFGIALMAGFLLMLAMSQYALSSLKVGGPLYERIKLGNDLVADILPPPEYVIEAYLETTLASQDPSSLQARKERLAQLKKDYDDRKEFWSKSALATALKSQLIDKSDIEVRKFWSAVEREFLPALERGDHAASSNAYASLTKAYLAHRGIIDALVKQTNDSNSAIEKEASEKDRSISLALWAVSALVVAIAVLGLFAVWIGIVGPIARMTNVMKALSQGELNVQIPSLSRRDEIGQMVEAVQVFRDTALHLKEMEIQSLALRDKADEERRGALLEMCEMLEADLDSAVGEVLMMSSDASVRGEGAAADARSIASEAATVATSSDQASNNVTSVSAAAEELSVTGREIAARAVDTARQVRLAANEAARASETVAALSDAAERINSMVSTISEVAAQTNLLALNATIEAARAGEMGKGFAVVAHEVKALARKTADAAEDISRRIENICGATRDSVAVINNIGSAIKEIDTFSASMASAAEEQEATLREVSRSLQEASSGVSAVARNVAQISTRSSEIERSSGLVSQLVNGTNGRVQELRANLVVSLRQSNAGDRRSTEYRRPVSIPSLMRSGSQVDRGTILDLSEGGLRFRAGGTTVDLVEGQPATIECDAFGVVPGTIIALGKDSVHLRFHQLGEERLGAIVAHLRKVDASDQMFVEAAKAAAKKITDAFEAAIANREIAEEAMFDFRYMPIPNTDPEQFETAYTTLCDRLLPSIQEPVLKLDPRVVFCAAVDLKSYLPTHNAIFSQAQRPNDPVWNAANSRNRRFFKDRAGMTAARTTRDFLMQTYDRNMGGGTVVTLKEVDVPIKINGRHWGGLRLAFKA